MKHPTFSRKIPFSTAALASMILMRNLRLQYVAAVGVSLVFILFTSYLLRLNLDSYVAQAPELVTQPAKNGPNEATSSPATLPPPASVKEKEPEIKPQPEPIPETRPEPGNITKSKKQKYKTEPTSTLLPVIDNFPLAAAAHSASDLPSIPPWNKPPNPHVLEKTPLYIGFTRNWRLLQQTVVSYITAGWPPEDIYVIENTGTMKSNELGLLSLQNPFFLNHTRLQMFGVNIVVTPTLLSFSQLQNFYIWMAIQNNITTYFYGHMDVIVLPYEDRYTAPLESTKPYDGFKTIYEKAVDALRLATASSYSPDPNSSNSSKPWAARFFAYDRLTLVNREAYESIGGWDTAIPYYFSDCDMHDRLKMYGFEYNGPDIEIGDFCDVSGSLDDLIVLYRKKRTVEAGFTVDAPPPVEKRAEEMGEPNTSMGKGEIGQGWESDELGSSAYKQLLQVSDSMVRLKNGGDPRGRNTWQARQHGGKGEPYYRDSDGFETAIQMLTQTGRNIYAEKWGHLTCDLLPYGLEAGDEWRVRHDWEEQDG